VGRDPADPPLRLRATDVNPPLSGVQGLPGSQALAGDVAPAQRVQQAQRDGGGWGPGQHWSRAIVARARERPVVGQQSPRQFRLDQVVVGPGVPLGDAQWARIEPLLPDRTPRRGGRWRDHREVIDAIAFKFQTGSQWVHLPERYGNWRGVCNRLRMWAADGTWERVFTALMAQADAEEDLNWAVSVDSTIVRAHQHAAGARKKGPRPASRAAMPSEGPAAG
jgi:transposase